MTPEFGRIVIQRLIKELSFGGEAWREAEDGELIGPGTVGIVLADDDSGPTHVDIGIELNRSNPDAPTIWDCVTGRATDLDEAAAEVVEVWRQSAWATVQELFGQRGEFAEHYPATDPEGVPGWHVIVAPIIGYGVAPEQAEALQRWIVANPLLAALAPVLSSHLSPTTAPHGVKFLIGGVAGKRTAEVRVDGQAVGAGGSALGALDWPTRVDFALARTYALFVHFDG